MDANRQNKVRHTIKMFALIIDKTYFMLNTPTELAMNFLCKRNPFDDMPQYDYIFLLMDFQDNKGDEALQALAGFYCYAIDNIGGMKGSEAIETTFAHDLGGAKDKFLMPKSSDYKQFWEKELTERMYYSNLY